MRDRLLGEHADQIDEGIATGDSHHADTIRLRERLTILTTWRSAADTDNIRATYCVQRKLGFTHEATLHKHHAVADRVHDTLVWTLLSRQYPGSAARGCAHQGVATAMGKGHPSHHDYARKKTSHGTYRNG